MYCSNPLQMVSYGPNKEREFIAQGRQVLYLVRVGSIAGFGSFTEFIASIEQAPLNANEHTYVFDDQRLGRLEGGYDSPLHVNGEKVIYTGFDPVGKNIWGIER